MSDLREPVRIAVVGLGYWGPNIARVLHDLREADIVWACDVREEALARLRRRYPALPVTTEY